MHYLTNIFVKFKLKFQKHLFRPIFGKNRIVLITEMGYTIALALVINFIGSEVWLAFFPQGGGPSFYAVPVILFAYRWGWRSSVVFNLIYGTLGLLLPGSVVYNVYQVLLDFVFGALPYTLVVITRKWLVKNRTTTWQIYAAFIIGPLLAFIGNFGISFWSGVLFYGQFASKGESVYLYSFFYNIVSTSASAGLTILVLLSAHRQFVRLIKMNIQKYH